MEPKIIAHRGVFDNESVIENTLESFKKALQYHYAIELDVQLTVDNKLVVFHDDDLFRLSGNKDVVQEMDSSELIRTKLLNTNSTIPLFQLVQGKVLLDIEIKPTKRIKETVYYLMKDLDGYQNYVIKSFDPRIIRFIKKNYPEVKVGLLIQQNYEGFFKQWILHTNFILHYSMCDFVAISKKMLKDKMMKYLKKYPIFVWTIKDSEEINYDDDVSYICNNLPYKKKKD